MRILYLSSEVVPFAKTGGLADVSGSLPKALEELGHDVRVIMPKYKMVDENKFGLAKIAENIAVNINGKTEYAIIYEGRMPGSKVVVYFVSCDKYFGRPGLYQENGVDYPDNCERFAFFCRAAAEFISNFPWKPEIVHANDWQSALIIPYIKLIYKWPKIATIYSVHNMGYLGLFKKEELPITGFSWDMFTSDKLEFWDQISLAKAGLVFTDIISTVSETYAKEIQTPEFGFGLDGLLRFRKDDTFGVINGLDYSVWNPERDPNIPKKYGIKSILLKAENKKALQKKSELDVKASIPLLGMTTRLAAQKGFDIFSGALDRIIGLNCQIVILGTGDQKYHDLLKQKKREYEGQLAVKLGFDAELAELIYAGSDMFLMPSKYEPCGLGQLISFKYGTVPVVRKTGGLADTVHEFNPKTGVGDGFVFEEYSADALFNAIKRGITAYKNKKSWRALLEKIMAYDYSWEKSAAKYVDLYKLAQKKTSLIH